MVKTAVEQLSIFLHEWMGKVPPGVLLTAATAFLESGKYLSAFRHEFVGTLLMIVCTFSAGKWVGKDSIQVAWASHLVGVIAADFFGGGPHVNPAVTVSMWTLGKCSYSEAYVRIAAQLGGGLIAFPLYHAISEALEWTPFGGPEFNMSDEASKHPVEPFLSEFFATLSLMFVIYILNWELNFGKFHYITKQTLTGIAIRALIELFPTAGPAMNPMLATTWAVFGVGKKYEYPHEFAHYFVYWFSPFLAAILASILYTIYAGGKIWGRTLPIGPIKKAKAVPEKAPSKKKKN